MYIEVDGNINLESGLNAVKNGADILVLGTASIFKMEKNLRECCIDFREKFNR